MESNDDDDDEDDNGDPDDGYVFLKMTHSEVLSGRR